MKTIVSTINLTKVRGYVWTLRVVSDEDGKKQVQVLETYVITDDDYNHAKQKNNIITLSNSDQNKIDSMVRKAILDTIDREEMDEADEMF